MVMQHGPLFFDIFHALVRPPALLAQIHDGSDKF